MRKRPMPYLRGALQKAIGGYVGMSDPRTRLKDKENVRGEELSQKGYETYGSGPEYNFFGSRAIPKAGSFINDQTPQTPKSSGSKGSSNNWATLAALGLIGADLYSKNKKKGPKNNASGYGLEGIDTEELHRRASDTSSLNSWAEDYLSNLKAPSLDGYDYGDTDFWDRMDSAARDTSGLEASGEAYLNSLKAPVLADYDPSLWEYLKGAGKTGMGALDVYMGSQIGGLGGYGTALGGLGDIAEVTGYDSLGGTLGSAGKVMSGIDEGGVKGYSKAAAGGLDLANKAGYKTGAASGALGKALSLYGAYTGLEGVADAYKVGDTKSAAIQGASAGASAGSLFGPIGTAAGAIIGGAGGILYTGLGGHSKMEAANEGAWDAFRKASKSGDVSFRDSGFPLTQAFEAANNATGYKQLDQYMRTGSKSKVAPQLAARNMLIKELEAAQKAGKLPKTDAELKNVNGVGFFEKEIAPKIWGNQKVDPNLVKLMGHQMDNLIHHGAAGYKEKPMDFKTMDHRALSEHASNPSSSYYQQARTELDRRNKSQGYFRGGLASMMSRRPGALSMVSREATPRQEDSSSYYRYGASPQPSPNMKPPIRRAMGGGLSLGYQAGGIPPKAARLVKGPGTGRSDDIPARLSDGEYVFDAETVALLGDGSTDEGARRLDALRKKLRMHKGRQLARGKFSSNAKDPEDYLE